MKQFFSNSAKTVIRIVQFHKNEWEDIKMISAKRTMMKAAALTAAVMLAAVSAPVMQGGQSAASLTAYAYEDTDMNYTTVEQNGMTFAVYSDHAEIKDCNDSTASLVIPSSVNGTPVTAVARYAMQFKSNLTNITFPDTIKTIGYYSFGFCKGLTSVKFPKNLDTIEMHAFEYCSNLSTVEFPSKLVKIHEKCFDSTPWRKSLTAQNGLVIVNGCLIDGSAASGNVTIPSDVKYVSPGSFCGNTNINSVVFPTGVTELCDNTFYMCSNLRSAELPSVTKICNMSFGDCPALNTLKISGSLTTIEQYAFLDTNSSATITFYGSKSKWDSVDKPSCTFLNNANMVYDESHSTPDPQPTVSPKFSKIEYNSQYHQIRFSWDKISGATNYGIAVKLAGKWRVQTTLPASTLSYTTPKNLTPGKSYQVALGVKINGEWTVAESVKNAVTVTVK